jgi:hypothetical protein
MTAKNITVLLHSDMKRMVDITLFLWSDVQTDAMNNAVLFKSSFVVYSRLV